MRQLLQELTSACHGAWDLFVAVFPLALLAALGGIVRAMQAGKCGLKAVAVAAITALFAGSVVGLLLSTTGWPAPVQAGLVGLSGYAAGEMLKILAVRACKWAEAARIPGQS